MKAVGPLKLTFFYLNGKQVGEHKDKDILEGIEDNLMQGEYILDYETKKVVDINNTTKPLYSYEVVIDDIFLDGEICFNCE
jgi:hypothetical protein